MVATPIRALIGTRIARSPGSRLSATYTPSRSSSGMMADLPPLKAHIYIDGTWLYYSLVVGRGSASNRGDPMVSKFGENWQSLNAINYDKLPQIISQNIKQQLATKLGQNREVEIVRTSAFTSMRADTPKAGLRMKMTEAFYAANYDVHRLVTRNRQEKCVDIMLAVEMLSMATVPEAYDIAVVVTGDKDFMPAMRKTREKGKRVAICSMRNSCNLDLSNPESRIRDFDNIWIEDYLGELIESKKLKYNVNDGNEDDVTQQLVQHAVDMLRETSDMTSGSRDIGRYFAARSVYMPDRSNGEIKPFPALAVCKELYIRMSRFFDEHTDKFNVEYGPTADSTGFGSNRDAAQAAREFQVTLRADYLEGSSGSGSGGGDDGGGTDVEEDGVLDSLYDENEEDDALDYLGGLDEALSDLDQPASSSSPTLSTLKLAELKELCKEQGLPSSGTKAVLVDRLRG